MELATNYPNEYTLAASGQQVAQVSS